MKADLVVSLVKAKAAGDERSFKRIVSQIAANEASSGHTKIANELKNLIEKLSENTNISKNDFVVPIARPNGELGNLLQASYPKEKLRNMVLSKENHETLTRVLEEQHHRNKFASFGLSPRRKFLLVGPPGSGKTMTAKMLAGELGLPLFVVKLEGLLSKYMGETLIHLTEIYKAMNNFPGVYLFDEFDSIGTFRGDSRDIGEVRRVLNTFLQLIENDESPSIIIAATNYQHILDDALFRRFDDILEFKTPTKMLIQKYLINRFKEYKSLKINVDFEEISFEAQELSFAEIEIACKDAIKISIMNNNYLISNDILLYEITKRKNINDMRKTNSE